MSPATSVAAEHLDWLKLVEVAGPFLSVDALVAAFPQGLDADDPNVAGLLRNAYAEWREAAVTSRPDLAIHRAFVDLVVGDVLGYESHQVLRDAAIADIAVDVPGRSERLRPSALLGDKGAEGRRMLALVHPPGRPLDRVVDANEGAFSAEEHARQLCLGTGVATALVTNGRAWTVVHAPPKRAATYARFDVELLLEERVVLRAFSTLLGARRLLGAGDDATLDALLERSKDDERDVTTQLGRQTRRAVELVVAALDQHDRHQNGAVTEAIRRTARDDNLEARLYEAAVAVVMRLVFLLAAEDRSLLPQDEPWLEGYSIHPMLALLRAEDEEILDLRYDAWSRLIATFRGVHGGVSHDDVRLPGYGGDLFDPVRYRFLERDANSQPVRVSNRTVFRILRELLELEVKIPGGGIQRRPLSYRALGVEQIGHVYEGLLEHTAVRAEEPVLGLDGPNEPELPVSELEALHALGDAALVKELKRYTGRGEAALRKALARSVKPDEVRRAETDLGRDTALVARVQPWLGLLPPDPKGRPVLIRPGQTYVTASDARRATGTHYTPRSLTEPIVKHALDPLCYEGCAAGGAEESWRLRRPPHVLGLKVADIAMGSGAFLVQACRYLSQRVVEGWAAYAEDRPTDLPADPEEQLLVAKRLVVERCLYGVDRNPLAVEMAKLSLWLETLQRDRPFTFVDHALRSGDSLVGITALGQLETLSLGKTGSRTLLNRAALEAIEARVGEATAARELIEQTDAPDLIGIEGKRSVLAGADAETARLRVVSDLICGAALAHAGTPRGASADELIEAHTNAISMFVTNGQGEDGLRHAAQAWLNSARAPGGGAAPKPFHWPLEFPEVFDGADAGFAAIVGNPPFIGGKKLSPVVGSPYREYLVSELAAGRRGTVDLAAYFFLRAAALLAPAGAFGLVATNTVGQGDTRQTGLETLVQSGWRIYRAVPSEAWPGEAGVYIVQVWAQRRTGPGAYSSSLEIQSRVLGEPARLVANAKRAFIGSFLYGMGFVVDVATATRLVNDEPTASAVVKPFIVAEDLTGRPDYSAARRVIDFGERTETEARAFRGPWSHLEAHVLPERRMRDAVKYPRLVHEWWKFWNARPGLYASIATSSRVLTAPLHTKWWFVCWLPNGWVYSHATTVFSFVDDGHAGVLTSSWHDAWARKWSGSIGTTLRYSPTDAFQTFPFPTDLREIGVIGAKYLQHRADTQLRMNQGLTTIYNRVHEDPSDQHPDIVRLRDLRVDLDQVVARAYGWTDLPLDHAHREVDLMGTPAVRFTVSNELRIEVLDRLLELNRERYAREVAEGLHRKGVRGSRAEAPTRKAPPDPGDQISLGI